MTRARAEASPQPRLMYVNHGLRPEAAQEGRAVASLAEGFGAPCEIREVTLGAGASLEASARDARYQALREVAAEQEVDWVLLAHTCSDQVETILMRILRGTGLVGLAGMPAQRAPFARPLLACSRRDTEEYCREHRLGYVEDSMNRDTRFTRSRLRHHWLPALRKENRQLDRALLRLADSARDHREVLDWAAERLLEECRGEAGALEVGERWRTVPDALAVRALVRHAAQAGVEGLENRHLQALLQLARAETAGTRELSMPGAKVWRRYDLLRWTDDETVGYSVEVGEGYRARRWQAGDRMRPERLKGRSRKLSDLFAEAKIARGLRPEAWVVERLSDGEIIWAQHIGHAFENRVSVRLVRAPGSAK